MSDILTYDVTTLNDNADSITTAADSLVKSDLNPMDDKTTLMAKYKLKSNYNASQDLIEGLNKAMKDKGKILKDFNNVVKLINDDASDSF